MIHRAEELSADFENLTFIQGDFMQRPLEPNAYDFVSSLAVLHHLPFVEGIERMKAALRPMGVLAILGLYKERMSDLPRSLVAVVVNQIYLRARNVGDRTTAAQAPIADPTMTLPEIKLAASQLLPGARFKTHLLWRYSLTWQKQ